MLEQQIGGKIVFPRLKVLNLISHHFLSSRSDIFSKTLKTCPQDTEILGWYPAGRDGQVVPL